MRCEEEEAVLVIGVGQVGAPRWGLKVALPFFGLGLLCLPNARAYLAG